MVSRYYKIKAMNKLARLLNATGFAINRFISRLLNLQDKIVTTVNRINNYVEKELIILEGSMK